MSAPVWPGAPDGLVPRRRGSTSDQILAHELELAAFNQLAAEGLVGLGIEQIDVLAGIAENVRHVDHARAFLVDGLEVGAARSEAARIMLRKLAERCRRRIVLPDRAQM